MATANDRIQEVFGLINREVWIVTSRAGGRSGGLLATWVSAASIDPNQPTVVIGLAPNHFTAELVESSGAFSLHLLGESHLDHVWHFALASGRDIDKFAGLRYRLHSNGSIVLEDCLGWLDCRVIARYDAGDRLYFWADVVEGERRSVGSPLGEKELLNRATESQRAALLSAKRADVSALGPLGKAWRNKIAAMRTNAVP